MRIPVFVSRPSSISGNQQKLYDAVEGLLDKFQLEPRRLGSSDYPTELPLREIAVMARHCAGGLILGFEQLQVTTGVAKRGTPHEAPASGNLIPTAWNHLEAGILFGMGLPLLVFREQGVSGGIFDNGVTDAFVHTFPSLPIKRAVMRELDAVFMKWQSKVRELYYRDTRAR